MEDKQVSLNAVIKFLEEDIAEIRYSFDGQKDWEFAAQVMEDLIDVMKNKAW